MATIVSPTARLSALNAELARHTVTENFDLQIVCAEHRYRLEAIAGSHLRLLVNGSASAAGQPAGTIEFNSLEAAQRLASGGQAAAMSLLAAGDLKLSGNSMAQLSSLQGALPQDAATVQRVYTLGHALFFSGAEGVHAAPWLPDRSATCCMACSSPFTITRRRHHCRKCGKLFCARCAPRPARGGHGLRTCGQCMRSSASPGASGGMPGRAPPHAPQPACAEGASPSSAVLMEYLVESEGRSEAAQVALWEVTHRVNARFLYEAVVALGGFWVKLAQAASVTTELPDAFGVELGKLQDAMPYDPISSVRATLRAELGPDWEALVTHIEPIPIGSATIAQVHRATIVVGGGREGPRAGAVAPNNAHEVDAVIKVQHAHVADRLLIDISASMILALFLSAIAPQLVKDLRPVIREIADLTRAELDFTQEASNQMLASQTLAATALRVRVPTVFPAVCTRKVLGMEYVDGYKLTEMASRGEHTREEVTKAVETLVEYYGVTMHGPIFNTDPHPGNLLVEARTGTLIVLDWGQAKRLSVVERLAHARLFLAIMMEDVNELCGACEDLGAPFADVAAAPNSTPSTMIGAMRFLLRDSKETKLAAKADFGKLNSALGGLSAPGQGDLQSIQGSGTDCFKGPLMPFNKTVVLLFEISTALGVAVPLLNILGGCGYVALLRETGYPNVGLARTPERPSSFRLSLPAPVRSIGMLNLSPQPIEEMAVRARLQRSLIALLEACHAEGLLLGAQLAVLDANSGQPIADIALGHCSWQAPQAVTSATHFNLCELSKLYIALAMLRLVERGSLSLADTIASEGVTLEHALGHTAGHLEWIYKAVTSHTMMCDLEGMAKLASCARPLIPPGARQQVHHTSYGWLLAHACTLAGTTLPHAWDALAAAALGPDGPSRLTLRPPPESAETPTARARANGETTTAAPAELAMSSKMMTTPTVDSVIGMLVTMSQIAARANSDDATAAEKAEATIWMSMFGKPQWLEPSSMATPLAKRSVLPGMQAYATATDAARVLQAAAFGGLLSARTVDDAKTSRKPPPSTFSKSMRMPPFMADAFGESAEWGLGVQLVPLPSGAAGAAAPSAATKCWGHLAVHGSFALVIPGPRPLVATFLVNRGGGHVAARRVLSRLAAFAAGAE